MAPLPTPGEQHLYNNLNYQTKKQLRLDICNILK